MKNNFYIFETQNKFFSKIFHNDYFRKEKLIKSNKNFCHVNV